MAAFTLDPTIHTAACVPRTFRQIPKKQYRDKQFEGGEQEWKKKLENSTTVYIGNLSCYTNEYQLYELFTRCGGIKRIVMGLDKIKKTPCGFCFIEFDDRESTIKSINYLNRTFLDGREIQVDIDAGFKEGRQYGRGAHGGQIGDERRREREQRVTPSTSPQGISGAGASSILTRSITVIACLTIILFIAASPSTTTEAQHSDLTHRPSSGLQRTQYTSIAYIRKAQATAQREQFERNFAQLLVNIMKTAKPSLMKAFIQATLADKELKDAAIKLFFNNTSSEADE